VLVKFAGGATPQQVADAHRRAGGQVEDRLPDLEVHVVRVPAGQERARAAAYNVQPGVEFAEVDGIYQALTQAAYPNDPLFDQQWQYRNSSGVATGGDINAPEVWNLTGGTKGNSSVAIAVLDSGIDQNHPDLPVGVKVKSSAILRTAAHWTTSRGTAPTWPAAPAP
jgi:thermitase